MNSELNFISGEFLLPGKDLFLLALILGSCNKQARNSWISKISQKYIHNCLLFLEYYLMAVMDGKAKSPSKFKNFPGRSLLIWTHICSGHG
jgi:hypothetical protein